MQLYNSLKTTIMSTLFFVSSLSLSAQTGRLQLDSLKAGFDPSEVAFAEAPPELPPLEKYESSWENLLRNGLKDFMWAHLGDGEVRWDYSIFSLNGYIPLNGMLDEFIKDIAYSVFNSPLIRKVLYEWASPYYKKAFIRISYNYQVQYMDMLKGAKAFLANFDLDKELQDLAADEAGFAWNKGKLNAFLFRRINSKQISLQHCRYWIDRIIEEFTPLMKDPADPMSYYDEVREAGNGNYIFLQYMKGSRWEFYPRYGALNKEGNVIIPPEYDDIGYYPTYDLWYVERWNQRGYIDSDGRIILFGDYSDMWLFNDMGLGTLCANVEIRDTTFLKKDVMVKQVYPPYEDTLYKKGSILINTHTELRFGFFRRSGKMVFDLIYTIPYYEIYTVSDNGDEVIIKDIQYKYVDFSNGVEMLQLNGSFGLVDTSGKTLVPFIYVFMDEGIPDGSEHNMFIANRGGKYIIDNENGNRIEGGKWALLDKSGIVVTKFKYTKLEFDSETGKLLYTMGKKHGSLDHYGKETPIK